METIYYLGVDIAKKTFQVALTTDGVNFYELEVENNARAIGQYFQNLRKKFSFRFPQLTVCLEHTGIYSYQLLEFLIRQNVKVCIEPALQIKRSQGMVRGKSDQVDARRIAQYAVKNHAELTLWKPLRPTLQKLKALMSVRDRLIKTKVQLEVPLREGGEFIEASIQKSIIKSCQHTLKALHKDISKVEAEIDALVKEDSLLKHQAKLATSVPGVGKITALNVILSTGEFERITEVKQFACYAGVAPFEHTSGSSVRGKTRVSKMANMNLKKLLHMAAMSAIQCNEELKHYYERKVGEGKNKMSVMNAVRNKLISRIFSCVKNQRLYQKEFQHMLV
jgi:transposase